MIRFVDLGTQIDEDRRQFAYFDTVTETFVTVSGEQVWESWADFIGAADCDSGSRVNRERDRFRGLAEPWVFDA
jgi:hypothetical protein